MVRARNVAVLLIVAAVSACSWWGGSRTRDPFPYITNAYLLRDDPAVIEVHVRDALPLEQVTLIDPNGAEWPAYEITRNRDLYRGDARPSAGVGVGVMGGSSGNVSTGIGIGFPLFSGSGEAYTATVNDSYAKLRIPDRATYDETWQSWKLRIELDDGTTSRTMEMLPPKPSADL